MNRLLRRRWLFDGRIIVSYALVTCALFWPVFSHFSSAIGVGSGVGANDGWQNVWNFWWLQYALSHGQNLFFTKLLYYPYGANLLWHTLDSFHGLLALPITVWVSPMAAFNTVALLSFIASGYTMYLLAEQLTHSPSAAWLAGGLFAFSPFRLTKLYDGQVELLCMQYLPLFVLWLIYALERPSWRWSAGCAALLVIITLTDLYYALFSLIYLGLYATVVVFRHLSWTRLWQVVRSGAVITIPVVLLVVPFLVTSRQAGDFTDWEARQILSSATPLNFIWPNPNSPWWGGQLGEIQQRLHLGAGGTSLGLAVLLLAAVALAAYRRQLWQWALLIIIIFVLELGPYLVINGRITGIRLPYALINLLPGAQAGRRPNHLIVYRSVLLALLAAWGWVWLSQHVGTRWRRLSLVAAVICVGIDLWPHGLQLSLPLSSPFYRQLATMPPGAILELPPLIRQSDYMQTQSIHQHPLAGGYLSRNPTYPLIDADGLRQLWNDSPDVESIINTDWTAALPAALTSYDITYVAIHLDKTDSEQYALLEPILDRTLKQVYRDARLIVYQRPPTVLLPSLRQGVGWYPVEHLQIERVQWTAAMADVTVVNPAVTSAPMMLEFTVAAYAHARPVVVEMRRGQQDVPLLSFTATLDAHHYRLLLMGAPGETSLHFATTADPAHEVVPRALGLMFTQLSVMAVTPVLPDVVQ